MKARKKANARTEVVRAKARIKPSARTEVARVTAKASRASKIKSAALSPTARKQDSKRSRVLSTETARTRRLKRALTRIEIIRIGSSAIRIAIEIINRMERRAIRNKGFALSDVMDEIKSDLAGGVRPCQRRFC